MMAAYQYPQQDYNIRSPLSTPLSSVSPLDAFSRSAHKNSINFAGGGRTGTGENSTSYNGAYGGYEGSGSAGSGWGGKGRIASGKGKGRAFEQDDDEDDEDEGEEGDTELAYGGRSLTPDQEDVDEDDQFADAASPQQPPPTRLHPHPHSHSNLSPLRQHTFQASISTLRTDQHHSDSDQAESPIVPDHPPPPSSTPTPPSPNPPPPIQRNLSHHPPYDQGQDQGSENEVESLTGDRSTWRSNTFQSVGGGGGGGGRESVLTTSSTIVPERFREEIDGGGGGGKGKGLVRESNLSTLTMESTGGDPFHYSVYESLPSPSNTSAFQIDQNAPPPPPPPLPLPTSNQAPPLAPAPTPRILRISETQVDLPNPHDSILWKEEEEEEEGSILPSTPVRKSSGSGTGSEDKGRSRILSQTTSIAKNFSRPFSNALPPPPPPPPPAPLSSPRPAPPPPEPIRSDSFSSSHDTHQSSSLGHSESHSLSTSWEGRQELEERYQRNLEGRSERERERGGGGGGESPAPFFRYGAANEEERAKGKESYRVDSYYANFVDDGLGSGGNGRGEAPPPVPVPTSPRQRNTLKKSPPPPRIQSNQNQNQRERKSSLVGGGGGGEGRWNLFKPRDKSRSRKSSNREVGEEGVGEEGYRFSGSSNGTATARDRERETTPQIIFSQAASSGRRGNEGLGGSLNEGTMGRGEAEREKEKLGPPLSASLGASPRSGNGGGGWSPAIGSPNSFHSELGEYEVESLGDRSQMMRRAASDTGGISPFGPQKFATASPTTTTTTSTSTSEEGRPPSLYSNYSFYSPEDLAAVGRSGPPSPLSRSPAPSSPNPRRQNSPGLQPPPSTGSGLGLGRGPINTTLNKAKAKSRERGTVIPKNPKTPVEFLQLGIVCHENDELERAAWYFEQSAKKDGGCGTGMLMYGLTLRHGWGCQVNHDLGFQFIQAAAEFVVNDLDKIVDGTRAMSETESSTKAVRNELVLALHELGISYRFGWGCPKDKKMAVAYFQLAADLGDMDAQNDLAFCFANGKGTKKDMRKAAKYYRMAVSQGSESFGLSWIYKEKYMER